MRQKFDFSILNSLNRKRRILIIGAPCTGKSTLAKAISESLEIKFVDLDNLLWQPAWVKTEASEFMQKYRDEIAKDAWVISGNISSTEEIILQRTDAIIWLDYPLAFTFMRGLRRSLTRSLKKEECCNGNFESLWRTFSPKDSVLVWILKTHTRRRRRYLEWRERVKNSEIEFYQIAKPIEVSQLKTFLCASQ